MKMILMMADAARWPVIREELTTLGAPGYSAIPVLEGAGRTGVHAGDRVHPGGLVAVFIVEPDAPANRLFDELTRRRDAAEDRVSRLFLLPVERES
jgi:Nitrogen regulatory protein P-II